MKIIVKKLFMLFFALWSVWALKSQTNYLTEENDTSGRIMQINAQTQVDISNRFKALITPRVINLSVNENLAVFEEDFSELNDILLEFNEELNKAFIEFNVTEEMYYAELDLLYEGILNNEFTDELYNEELSSRGIKIYNWMVSVPIDITLISIASGAYASYAGVKLIGKFWGNSLARSFCQGMAGVFKTVAEYALQRFFTVAINVIVGKLGNAMFGAFWALSSLGNLIAYSLDLIIDGSLNGVIYSW